MSAVVRPTSDGDMPAARVIADWAQPDHWRAGARSAVATHADRIVGIAISTPNAVHPVRRRLCVRVDAAHRRSGVGTALVAWMRDRGPGPFAVKAAPHTPQSRFWLAVGAIRYQSCPAQRVDVRRSDVQAWATSADPHGSARSASSVALGQLVEAVAERYWWQHMSWSPMSSRQIVHDAIEPQVRTDTDLPGSAVVVRDGRISAVADLYPADGSPVPTAAVEAVDPSLPSVRDDVAACAAFVLRYVHRAGARYLEFDGHVTDPHFYPVLRSMPEVHGAECELLEIPASCATTGSSTPTRSALTLG